MIGLEFRMIIPSGKIILVKNRPFGGAEKTPKISARKTKSATKRPKNGSSGGIVEACGGFFDEDSDFEVEFGLRWPKWPKMARFCFFFHHPGESSWWPGCIRMMGSRTRMIILDHPG